MAIILGIVNAIYFNKINNKEDVSEGIGTTLLWLNIIMIILYTLLLIWSIVSLIMNSGKEETYKHGTVVHHKNPQEAVIYHKTPQHTTVVRHKNPQEAVIYHKTPTTMQRVTYEKDISQIPLKEPTNVLKPSNAPISVNSSQMVSY